jgi:hypothetical protein
MAIINVPSATQGKSYSIKISGDVPTPTEQARIQKYVADQDAASQALVAKYFPAATEQAETAPEKGGLAGIGTALGRGVDLTQQGLYSAAEGIGSSTGIDWLRDFGKAGAEFNTKQLEESAAARTQLEDVKGVGSGLSFVGETAAESAAPLGVAMLGAGAAGAAAGSIFGPVGTAAGAIIGAGGAALSQLPLFYGWNRERQKQEDVTAGRPVEVDEGVAALAAIPQATIEGIADRFLVGKLLPPSFINKGMWLTRLGKGAAAGTVAEVPTEVGQQILERWQAGLPVDDDEAIEEYRQAAIAAAAVGGTIGGASAAIGGDQKAKDDAKLKELKKKQLAEDSSYMADYTDEARKFAEQNTAELYAASTSPTGETQVTPDEMLMLPSPTAFGKSKLKVAPIINPAAYSPEMRKQALDIATSRGKVTIGELNQALTELNQSNVSPKAVASLVQDLKKDGILRRAGRNGLAPTKGALQSRARLDSLNNSANQFDAEAQSLSQRNEELAANLRSAEQTGVDLSGKKANPSDIGRQIDQNTRDIEARKKLAESARADALKLAENIAPKQRERTALPHGIKAGPLSQATPKAALARQEAILQSLADNSNATKELNAKKRSLSNRQLSSVEQVALDDVNRKLEALKARRLALKTEAMSPEEAILDAQNQEAAEAAKVLEAQAQAEAREQAKLQRLGAAGTQQGEPLAPIFSSKMQNVFDSLRQYMSKMNVGNFGLAGANILDKFNDKGERETSEGLYDPGLRLISVSMGIYDPKLSEQELFDRIARVVDHEVIHALKSQGVFSEADWASLTRAASTMKYKAMKNGKLQDREYTYLERAQSMYAGQALDPPDWPNTTVALDLLSPQVLKELRKAAYQKKVKLGETVSISTIENLIGEETAKQVAKIEFAAEEAVAEMFRDYVDGRVKFVGKPKSLFDRVKDFFRALIGASIKNGIPNAQSILDDIKSGAVGARQQGIAPKVSQPVAQPLSAARTPSAAPVVAAPTPPVQAPAPVITEVPAPAQVQPTPEPVIAQAPEPIVEAPAPTPAPVSKTPAVEPEIKVDLPQKARKYGSVLKKNGALNVIGKFAFTFEADRINGKDHNRLRVITLDGSKIFQSSNGSERDANVVDIWDVPDPNTVEHRGGSKVGIDSVGENVPPDLAPIFLDFLEGKIDPEETIKRIKNTDLGEADKSNGTSGVRQSKMTADFTRDNPGGEWLEGKQARAAQYPDRKFMMGSITGVIGGRTNMFLPTDVLSGFAGLNDEKRGAGEVQYERLLAEAKKNGFDQNQKGNKVVVAVNHYGQPYLLEGNTRVAVASALGIPTVKAEVRYWNGGEDVSGPMEPNKVLAMASPAVRQSKMTAEKAYKIRNDAYKERASLLNGKNVFSYPTKSEMQAWIAQSDMRYQDAPKVLSKSIFSPEFKLFFGKSQIVVVDQNGVEYPRRVFHGGPHGDIYEFDFSKIGPEELGFHVGTAEQANEFAFGLPRESFTDTGNLYPLYVRLENPVRLRDLGSWNAEKIFPQMKEAGLINDEQLKRFMIAARTGSTGSQEKIRNILQSLGYDGVSYLNRYEGFSQEDIKKADDMAAKMRKTRAFLLSIMTDDQIRKEFPSAQDSYILLKPTQIKSAVGNNGEYSTLNKDIRYSALVPKKGNENGDQASTPEETGNERSPEGVFGKENAAAKAGSDTSRFGTSNVPVTIEDLLDPSIDFKEFLTRPGWVIMSATDTKRDPDFRAPYNVRNAERLRNDFNLLNLPYIEVYGEYLGDPDGVSFMTVMDSEQARRLAERYNQDSIITSEGLTYVRPVPPTKATGEVVFDSQARIQDSFTYIPDRDTTFSLILDGDTWPGTPVIPDGYEELEVRKQLPVKDGKVRLLHWSPSILTELDPKFAGTRKDKGNRVLGAERNDKHKKVFFGINPRESQRQRGTGYVKENLGENMHEAFVDPMQLYPWYEDPDKLWNGPTKELTKPERDEYETLIINAGYLGSYVTEQGDRNKDNRSYAPLGNIAVVYYPIEVKHVTKERQSRMVADVKPVSNVPKRLKRLTVLDMMDPNTGVFIQRGGKKITVIEAIQELFDRRSDTVIMPDDPNAVNRVAELIALEAQMALLRNPGAIGWYGKTLALAKRVASMAYPEISPVNAYSGEKSNSYIPMHEHIWDLATAITSNGQAVVDNLKHAAEQYDHWVLTGRFKLVGYGDQATGIIAGLKFYNSMKDAGYSDEQIQEFLSQKMTVKDLKSHPVIVDLGVDVGSAESVDTEVYGSYVLGPKIGQGFYQNLRGNFDPLTMDLWFSRLFNRITGRPFASVKDETKVKNFERIVRGAENPMITEYEKSLLDQAKAAANIDIITPETVGPLAIAYDKIFQRDYTRAYNQEIKRLKDLGYDVKLQETKELAKAARPEKTELIKAMGTASQNFQSTEQADPRNSSERTFMRQVIDRAQVKVLKATGISINTADFQALLWYAEKQLFKAMNVREGRGGDNDYVDGSIAFLREKGLQDEEIARSLPETERDRLVSGTDSGRQNAGVLSGAAASNSRQADSSNQLLPQTPNGDSEATVARNGGIGSRAKPKRGAAAVAEAKKETPVRLSRLMAHTPQGRATPFTGHSDLLKHADTLRYAAVQGAVSRLIQRTVGKYFKIDPSIIEDKTTNFFKKMQDDMIHVGKLYDNLRGKGIDIPQEYDAYFQEQLMRDAAGAKKQDFQQGFLKKIVETAVNAKFDSTNISSLEAEVKSAIGVDGYITQIMKKVGNESHAIANAYLYALHAKERNQRIREMSKGKDTKGSGMSDAEADAILNWKNTLPRDQQNALENVDKLAQDIIWMTNDEYIQGGLIPVYNDDKAILDDGTEVDFPQYDNYVPLRGFTDPENSEDAVEGGGGGGSKFGAKGKPNKSSVGRTSYAGDILVNIGTQYEAAVDKAARNKVGQSFLSLLEDGGVDLSDIAFVYESHPLMKAVVNGTIRTVPSRDFNDPDLPILPVRRNGKEILIGFHDANIGAAMKGTMGSGDPNVVMSAIHNVTRFYANLLTSWNPAFVLGNLPRDIETAIFNSQQYNMKGSSGAIIKKVGPSIKAIWGEINKTGAGDPHLRMRYRQFYENGGQSVFSGMVSLTNSTKGVKGIINEVEGLAGNNPIFKSKHFFTKTLLGKVEAANNAVENGTRLAFFDAMMNELEAQGVPTKVAAKRAAYAAKNLTTNFTKGGEFRNGLNTFYLFYNASLQGSMAMMNSLVRSKNARKMAASIIVMGFMMDMLNAAASDDEDEDGILDYDNFNDNRLENYILIPDFSGTGTHISIPLAYGLNIFYNAGRTLSNFTRGIAGAKGTYTAGEAAASTIGKVTSTLNPFGGNNMLSMLSPTQTDLIVELVTNKDFKDQPIYKELSPFDQSKSQSNLYWSSTSPSAVWMSKFLNDTIGGGTDIIPGEILGNRVDIQPDIIEHVLGFITGGLGTFVGASFDTATSTIPDAFAGRWEADMIGKTPILNKFLTKTTEKDKAGDYYDNRDKVMVVSAEIKDAIKSGDAERIAAARSTYPERIKVMGRIAEIEKRLLKLRKTRKLIVKSATMPEDKKQKSIDNIDQAINKLMSLGNQIMGEAGV